MKRSYDIVGFIIIILVVLLPFILRSFKEPKITVHKISDYKEPGGAGNPNPDWIPMKTTSDSELMGGNMWREEIRVYHEDGTYSLRYKDHNLYTP